MSSPPPKRIRLSPDDQPSALDAQLSQSLTPIVDDAENPFRSCQASQSARIYPSFTSASALDAPSELEDKDQAPPEIDYAAWFNSDSTNAFVGFRTATTAMPGFERPSAKGGNAKSLFVPSAAALREAEEKMKKWQDEIRVSDQPPTCPEPDSDHSIQTTSPPRPTFSSARNAYFSIQELETPTPTSIFRSANAEQTPSRLHSSLQCSAGKQQTKPFKSPMVSITPSQRQASTPSIGSPLRICRSSATIPPQLTPAVSPLRPSSVVNHVATQKPLGFTPRQGSATTRPKFVTPFKTAMKSIAPKSSLLENIKLPPTPPSTKTVVNRVYPPSVLSPRPNKRNSNARVFDLTPPPGRQTLAASGLRPHAYTVEQLEDMGINFKELSQVNPRTAPFYDFTTRSRCPPCTPDLSPSPAGGRLAVLEELHSKGCTLAKQAWVDNHWSLVLWKLAGMVALDPLSESNSVKKRWCWPEVVRQLMYRYERDLNSSSRPPLRLITTRDASAESPMVLCVSDIIWPACSYEQDTIPIRTRPELEVTDGWYRLRARIDAPLARALRKGKIKIGRKIAVMGARLSAERKEGSEVLEAYDSCVLLLTGNSTHMAPWHAKLGFRRGPFIATLNSLTADGGNVAVMMLTIAKVHPIAYIEFVEDTDGRKQRVGPHDAKEELKLSTQWKTKRDLHASRLWTEYEKRRYRLLDHAERLEQRAGSEFRPMQDDGPPDRVYDLYDTLLEDADAAKSIISSIGHEDAGWLARRIRERTIQDQDVVSKEIEQELESICPSRDVKAFCVIVVNDARTYKYSSERTAQVTVWDMPGLSASEDYAQSSFVPDQRYLVTNLVPTQASAWMDRSSGGEVYLSTRKNSRWTLVR